jgi:drug/metabolite transporter (DMT)-like permease
MQWFLIALAAPILWAFVNVADNYLVTNFSEKDKERSSAGLALFSSLVAIVISVIIVIFTDGIFAIPFFDKVLLFITGVLTLAWILMYLFALEMEEPSNVAPWFLSVPIFGYILAYIFLGETLTQNQILGSLVVLCGLAVISIDFSGENKKIKRKPVFYMIFACLFVAISGVIFKYVTVENYFWISSFWEYVGLAVTGILIFLFSPKHRNQFMNMNKKGGLKIFILNTISEIFTISGNLLTNFALLLAPVTMVYLVGSLQPAFVLFLTILGTKFFPHIVKENVSRKVLIPKIIAISLMILGSLFLFL